MKKPLLLSLSLMLSIGFVCSQQKVNKDELLKEKNVYYLDGKPFTGVATGFDSVAQNPFIFTVVDGLANGVKIWYFDQDMTKIRFTVPVVNDKQHGQYVGYNEDGTLLFTLPQRRNNSHGIRYCFTEEGVLWHIHTYRKGKEHGPKTTFYTNTGNLSVESNYRKGKLHGRYVSYSSDGYRYVDKVGRYKNGKKNGVWKFYDIHGDVVKKEKYKDGKLFK